MDNEIRSEVFEFGWLQGVVPGGFVEKRYSGPLTKEILKEFQDECAAATIQFAKERDERLAKLGSATV